MGAPLGYLGAGALQGAVTAEQTRHERHEAELAYGLKAGELGLQQQQFHEATRQQKIATATALWNAAHTRMGQADFPFIPQSEQDYYHQLDAQGTQLFREAGFNIPDSPGAPQAPAQQPVAPQGPPPDLSHYQQATDAQMAGGAVPPAIEGSAGAPLSAPPRQGAPHPFGLVSYPGVSLPNATDPRETKATLDHLPPNLRALLLQGGQQPGGVEADLIPPAQAVQLNPGGALPPAGPAPATASSPQGPSSSDPFAAGAGSQGVPGQPGLDASAIFGDLSKLSPTQRLYVAQEMQRLQEGQAGIAHTTAQAREQNALADQGPAEIDLKHAMTNLYGAQGSLARQEADHYAERLQIQGLTAQAELVRAIASGQFQRVQALTAQAAQEESARQNRVNNALHFMQEARAAGKDAHTYALDYLQHSLSPGELLEATDAAKHLFNLDPIRGGTFFNQEAANVLEAIKGRHPQLQGAIDALREQATGSPYLGQGSPSAGAIGTPGPATPAVPAPPGVDPQKWGYALQYAGDPAAAARIMGSSAISAEMKAMLKQAMGALQQRGAANAGTPRGAARRPLPAQGAAIKISGKPVGRIGQPGPLPGGRIAIP